MTDFGDSMARMPLPYQRAYHALRARLAQTEPEPYLAPARFTPSWDVDDPLGLPRLLGARDGRLWHGDPVIALQSEGVSVQLVSHAEMQHRRGLPLGVDRVAAFYHETTWPESPTVCIDEALSERQALLSAGHELCHMSHSTWSEEQCEAYAIAFLSASGS